MKYVVTSTVSIEVEDRTPVVAGACWYRTKAGAWAPQGVDVLRMFLGLTHARRARHIVDVGESGGTWALAFAELPLVESVTAYEPADPVFELLMANAAISEKREKIDLTHAAVGAEQRRVRFLLASNAAYSHAGSRMLRQHGPQKLGVTPIEVDMVRLDDQPALWERGVDAIKIDVEGSEFNVLRGGIELIEAKRPLILFEDQPTNLKQHGIAVGSSIKLLSALGYSFKKVGTCDVLATPLPRKGHA